MLLGFSLRLVLCCAGQATKDHVHGDNLPDPCRGGSGLPPAAVPHAMLVCVPAVCNLALPLVSSTFGLDDFASEDVLKF